MARHETVYVVRSSQGQTLGHFVELGDAVEHADGLTVTGFPEFFPVFIEKTLMVNQEV